MDEELKISLRLPSNQKIFYTDIVAIPNQNKALIIRNDYVIFEIDTLGFDSVQEIKESNS